MASPTSHLPTVLSADSIGRHDRIQSASRVQKSAVRVNKGIVRKAAIDIEAAKSALGHKVMIDDSSTTD